MAKSPDAGEGWPGRHLDRQGGAADAAINMFHFDSTSCCAQRMHQHPATAVDPQVVCGGGPDAQIPSAIEVSLDFQMQQHTGTFGRASRHVRRRAGNVAMEAQSQSLRCIFEGHLFKNRFGCAPCGIAQQESHAMPDFMPVDP